MTFPPCFSSFAARPTRSDLVVTNRNLLLMNTLRQQEQHQQQQQQSRVFSTSTALSSPPMQLVEPRSATPDLTPEDSQDSTITQDSHEEQDMEDNAARMLLELSKIVTKEISADSSCISRSSQDMAHKKSKNHEQEQLLHQETIMKEVREVSDRVISGATEGAFQSVAIPKSIEIHSTSPNWGSASHQSSIPRSFPSSSSLTTSPLTPNTLSRNNSSHDLLEHPPRVLTSRYRTVSLAGDEMASEDRELSPLLVPLNSSPLPPKDLAAAFPIHESPARASARHLPRLRQHSLFGTNDLPGNLDPEVLRRALVGAGAATKALSAALAASAKAPAAVITPVPEKPRKFLSFPATSNPSLEARINPATSMHEQRTTEERKRLFPMDLPPLLFHSHKKNNNHQETNSNPTVSGVVARSYGKPPKRVASLAAAKPLPRKAATKKQQPVHGPKTKKKASPKKPQRQRHSGKKFSWKAYPELEEFLITNREEYLSFSARNYTIEQRDYNNRLTSRLLEHADASGYSTLFESCAFSAVRDRIRSYYKSYVQSFKRRRERQEQQERLKKLEMESH